MKPSKQVFAVVLALTFAQGARASVNSNAPITESTTPATALIEDVRLLLERLREAHALEVDVDGNVRVKPSVLEQLRAQGRLVEMAGSYSSICN